MENKVALYYGYFVGLTVLILPIPVCLLTFPLPGSLLNGIFLIIPALLVGAFTSLFSGIIASFIVYYRITQMGYVQLFFIFMLNVLLASVGWYTVLPAMTGITGVEYGLLKWTICWALITGAVAVFIHNRLVSHLFSASHKKKST